MFEKYDGAIYRYIHSPQSDIAAIVDAAGNRVVEYKYDAWGKPIYEAGSMLSSLGNLNPFRYRGYDIYYEVKEYYNQGIYEEWYWEDNYESFYVPVKIYSTPVSEELMDP